MNKKVPKITESVEDLKVLLRGAKLKVPRPSHVKKTQ